MTLGTILLVVLILLLIGAIPAWPYNRDREWGYAPMGGLGTILLIVIILWLLGVIR
jgi:hypothetical protein